jgi:hypothetical protein
MIIAPANASRWRHNDSDRKLCSPPQRHVFSPYSRLPLYGRTFLGIASAKTSSLYRYIMSSYKPRTQLCNSGASRTSCRGVISLVLQTTQKRAIFLVNLSSISNSCSTTDCYHLPSYPIIPLSVSNRLGQERLKKGYLRDCDNRFRVVKKRD